VDGYAVGAVEGVGCARTVTGAVVAEEPAAGTVRAWMEENSMSSYLERVFRDRKHRHETYRFTALVFVTQGLLYDLTRSDYTVWWRAFNALALAALLVVLAVMARQDRRDRLTEVRKLTPPESRNVT
jgi:hypothetical protein